MKTKVKHKQPVLDKRIEIWGKIKETNELNQTVYKDDSIKKVWASIVPQTGKLINTPGDTKFANVTHKIKIRYAAFPEISREMWLKYKDKRFDINFILNPYERNEFHEIFAEQVL
ncbi:phage head-tail adaptor, putative, SPP1 family [Natronincola peptidivorans]|uniref:Phage head-tail adaptor, putative, SPP1 family n=1 Tax=Natronincola peptidivorans TaxID=426128 RepID=A0A1I0FBS2_9FIRM|nr:phage head closure protein [Natronincola peptidivorans]SET55592.1 phage head-tail adaptor, putative, SPP1 family [Natronincola peptidivorans]